MSDILTNVPDYLSLIAQALGALVVLATVIVRIPGVGGDEDVEKYGDKIFKLIDYLPTIGINPKTKKIKDAYVGIKGPAQEEKKDA